MNKHTFAFIKYNISIIVSFRLSSLKFFFRIMKILYQKLGKKRLDKILWFKCEKKITSPTSRHRLLKQMYR